MNVQRLQSSDVCNTESIFPSLLHLKQQARSMSKADKTEKLRQKNKYMDTKELYTIEYNIQMNAVNELIMSTIKY